MIPSNGRAAMSLAEVRIGSGARADMHCHSTASGGGEARHSAQRRAAGVRDAARGGLRAREAPRHGLRDDHRPRHDRRLPRDRRPRRRLRLRGADHLVRRGAPGGARPLLRHRPGRPRVPAGTRRATSRSAPPICTSTRSPARSRIRSSRSPHRSARATGVASPSCFRVWEIRNGSRAPELNMPAAVYVETHGGTGVGGSDDHAGVDIGRTWTETPASVDAGRVSRPRPRAATRRPAARRAAPRSGRTRRSRSPRGRCCARAIDGRARVGRSIPMRSCAWPSGL